MKLLAIDGNSVLNRAFYGIRPLTTKEGINTNALVGFTNILFKLLRDISPDAVAIAFDVSRKTFRNEKYDQYKATRKGMPAELAEQLPYIKEILTLMGYTVLGVEGFEGDDLLGTLSKGCNSEDSCIVATGDRDCLQLINDNVSVCLLKNQGHEIYDHDKVLAEYSITPHQIIDLKSLMGDSSDNIPGVKGIGEKTAISLIEKNHSLENLYENIDNIEATPRIKNLLKEHKADAFMSYSLATICCEVPIEKDPTAYVKKPTESEKLTELLTKLELMSLLKKLSTEQDFTSAPAKKPLAKANETPVLCDQKASDIINLINDKVYIHFDETATALNIDGKVYCLNAFEQDTLIKAIAEKNVAIYTNKAKPLVKHIRELADCDINLAFDLEVAAYLINPDQKSYDITSLCSLYLAIDADPEDSLLTAKMLPMLYDVLYERLKSEEMLSLFLEIELPLTIVLADMELEGIAVDKPALEKFGGELYTAIEELKEKIFAQSGEVFNINSTKELGTVLFEKLGLPAKKKTKTGYSTNADVLEDLFDMHPIVPLILEYRQLTKLHSTYVVGLCKVIGDDSRIHTTFNQTETRTGRISSIEPNLQNIPVRTKLGSELRKFFVSREGYTLVDADYSQIELRILAHIANDSNMINSFLQGADIHSNTASQVFNCPIEELSSTLRSRAKAINFGIVYGISAFSLSKDINVSVAEAKEYMNAYLRTYSGVKNYMESVVTQAKADSYVTTLYGRKRPLADINSTNKLIRAFAERVALNAPIQGTAADIIKLAMVRVHKRLLKSDLDAHLVLQIHDELIIEAPAMQAEQVKALLKEEMENTAKLAVPLTVDVHEGKNWYIAKG